MGSGGIAKHIVYLSASCR